MTCAFGRGCAEKINLSRFFHADIPETEIRLIRESLEYGDPTGSEKFRDEIEAKLGIRLALNKRGRPKKVQNSIGEVGGVYGIC